MTKRVLSLILTVVTILSLAVPAFAEEPEIAEEPIVTQEPAEPTEAPAEPEPTEEPAEETAEPEATEEPVEPEATEEPAESAEPEVTAEPAAEEDIAPIAEEDIMPIAAEKTYHGTCGANLEWTATPNGNVDYNGDPYYDLTITGTGPMTNYKLHEAPWAKQSLAGYIQSVTIGEGVTSVGNYAFSYCYDVEKLTLPSTLITVGDYAFAGCTPSGFLRIPDNVTSIGKEAFSDFGGSQLSIGAKLKTIGEAAFDSNGFSSFAVDKANPNFCDIDGVLFTHDKKELLAYPRDHDTNFYSVPAGTKSIAPRAFCDVAPITVVLPEGLETIGSEAFIANLNLISVKLPEGLKTIGDRAFGGCYLYGDIVIPDSVTSIGDGAYSKGLRDMYFDSFHIGKGLTSLGADVFEGATVGEFTVDEANTAFSAVEGSLYDKGVKKLIQACNSVQEDYIFTVPETVTAIGDGAFQGCYGLTELTLPKSVASIGYMAFSGCRKLTKLTIENPSCKFGPSSSKDKIWDWYGFLGTPVIRGYEGSTAQAYAKKYATKYKRCFKFESMGKAKIEAPANIAAAPASTGIKLSWNKAYGASKYRVYYRAAGTEEWSKAGDTSKTSYTWTKAKPGTAYELTVCCLDKKSKANSEKGEAVAFTWAKTPSITLSNTTEGIKASWSSDGAVQYKVTVNGAEQSLASGSTIPVTESNTKYTLTVQAVDAKGAPMSAAASKSITFLSAPKISRIERASSGIKISWDKVTGAAKYRVYYRTDPAGSWKKLANTGSTSYTWKKAKTGTKYYFSVVCMDKKYKTATSAKYEKETDTYAILAAPSVTLSNQTNGVKVSWKDVPLAKQYKVTVKQGDAVIEEPTVTGTEHTFTGALNDTTYKVTVEALGNEEWISNKVSSTKSIEHLNAPVITEIKASTSGIQISWGKVAGASRYRVYYATKLDTDETPAWKTLANTKSTSYNWKKAKPDIKYYFTVVCMDSKYKKATSAKYDDTNNAFTLLKTPAGTTALAKKGVDFSWNAIDGAEKYKVTVKKGKTVVKETEVSGIVYHFTEAEGAANNTTYSFTVQALDASGKTVSKLSSSKSRKYLAPPVITSAEAVSNGIKVSWAKVKGASKYQVCYLDESGSVKKIATVSSKSLSYTWKKAVSGTEYQIVVRCMDSKGKKATSALSDTKTVTYTK